MRPIANVGYYLTEDCSLRCEYCFVSKNPKRSNFDVGKATIDWLLSPEISGNAKQTSISFFGGEPMLDDSFKTACRIWRKTKSKEPEEGKVRNHLKCNTFN